MGDGRALKQEGQQPLASAFERFSADSADFLRSVGHAALQSPLDGMTQLVNHAAGKELLPHLHLIDRPRHADFGTASWHLQQIGGAVGLVIPFGLLNKGVRAGGHVVGGAARFAGLGKVLESPLARAALPVAEAGATGALFEGLLRPVQAGEGNFNEVRGRNAIAGALTFGTLQAATMGLKGFSSWRFAESSPWLINGTGADMGRHLIAGGLAGAVDAEARSLLSGKGAAAAADVYQSAYGFMFVGGALRGSRWAADRMQGRESVADVISRDRSLQETVRQSPTAMKLVAGLGEVTLTRSRGSLKGEAAPVEAIDTLTGDHFIRINGERYTSADALGKTQLIVRGLSQIETAASFPVTWRHAGSESAYTGLMTARAKTAAARELNFVKEIEAGAGRQDAAHVRAEAIENWSRVAESSAVHEQFRNQYKERFGRWGAIVTTLSAVRASFGEITDRITDKEHLLSLREFDVKVKDAEMREAYQSNMGPPAGQEKGPGELRNEKLDRVKDLIPADARLIVDMGAGGGQFTKAMKSLRPAAEVIALDLSGQMVKDLKEARQKEGIDFRVEHGDAMLPDFPRESVDVITGNSHTHEIFSYPNIGKGHYRLEHLQLMFANYGAMLKPGGRIFIQDFIVPRYGSYQGPYRVTFKTQEGRSYFEQFTHDLSRPAGELGLDHMMPAPEYRLVDRGGKGTHGTIEGSAPAAGEFLLSSMYGMRMERYGWPKNEPRQHEGVLMEKFANVTRDGMVSLVKEGAPQGFHMEPLRVSTYTSPDYLAHWQKHFQIEVGDGKGGWRPVTDMENFHTRIVLAAEKVPTLATAHTPSPWRAAFPSLNLPETRTLFRFISPGALSPFSLPTSFNVSRVASDDDESSGAGPSQVTY